jgi:hypothetical protein
MIAIYWHMIYKLEERWRKEEGKGRLRNWRGKAERGGTALTK